MGGLLKRRRPHHLLRPDQMLATLASLRLAAVLQHGGVWLAVRPQLAELLNQCCTGQMEGGPGTAEEVAALLAPRLGEHPLQLGPPEHSATDSTAAATAGAAAGSAVHPTSAVDQDLAAMSRACPPQAPQRLPQERQPEVVRQEQQQQAQAQQPGGEQQQEAVLRDGVSGPGELPGPPQQQLRADDTGGSRAMELEPGTGPGPGPGAEGGGCGSSVLAAAAVSATAEGPATGGEAAVAMEVEGGGTAGGESRPAGVASCHMGCPSRGPAEPMEVGGAGVSGEGAAGSGAATPARPSLATDGGFGGGGRGEGGGGRGRGRGRRRGPAAPPPPFCPAANGCRLVAVRLTLEEAFFLHHVLQCLEVYELPPGSTRPATADHLQLLDSQGLWRACRSIRSNFVTSYVAYHHLKAKGWLPRSGLLYGVDFVTYQLHPAGAHSDYGIMVLPLGGDGRPTGPHAPPLSWLDLQITNRLINQVVKRLILLYVLERPGPDHSTPACLQNFAVEERIVRRWVPDATRD